MKETVCKIAEVKESDMNLYEIEVEITAVKRLIVAADNAIEAEDAADEIVALTTIPIKPSDEMEYSIIKVTEVTERTK